MDPLNAGAAVAGEPVWLRVEEPSSAGAVRRAAEELAESVGMRADRAGEVAIAASELATNVVKYGGGGWIVLRTLHAAGLDGVELLAVDSGPGMADPAGSLLDGATTGGSLGVGLGAVARLSTTWHLWTAPGRGTVVHAGFSGGSGAAAAALGRSRRGSWPDGPSGLARPLAGEAACGDAWAARPVDGGWLVTVVDGLGHGPLAARAAQEAVAEFGRDPEVTSPAELLEAMHRRLAPTRGAAVCVVRVDVDAGRLAWAGLGNIGAWSVTPARRRGLPSVPGIVGSQRQRITEAECPLEPESVLVLHSDGLTDRWDLTRYPGAFAQPAVVTAGLLLRDAAVRRDDACALVAVLP